MSNGTQREFQNTDRELWREREGDYYADSIHVTQGGNIGINCGGRVIVMPIRKWHEVALRAASETKGERHEWDAGGERCVKCGDKDWIAGPVCNGKPAATPHPEAVVKESLTPHSDHPMRVRDRTCPACAEAEALAGERERHALLERIARVRIAGMHPRLSEEEWQLVARCLGPELAALRSGGDARDAERMDWLDRIGAEFGHGFLHLGYGDYEFYVHAHHNGDKYPSAREVIDAALARKPEGQ